MTIEKLSNYKTYEGVLLINGDRIKALGIEWKLCVQIKNFKNLDQKEEQYVGLFLYAIQTPSTQLVSINKFIYDKIFTYDINDIKFCLKQFQSRF